MKPNLSVFIRNRHFNWISLKNWSRPKILISFNWKITIKLRFIYKTSSWGFINYAKGNWLKFVVMNLLKFILYIRKDQLNSTLTCATCSISHGLLLTCASVFLNGFNKLSLFNYILFFEIMCYGDYYHHF